MKLARLLHCENRLGVTVSITQTARERMRGLLGRERLLPDEALLLTRCGSVHTFGMRFAIDVLFLDRSERVLAIHHDVRRRRMLFNFRATQTLEMSAGAARTLGLVVGDQLALEVVS